MKVAITLNTSWNIYNFRMGIIRRLLAEGHEVLAIAPRDEYSRLLEEAGCSYLAIPMDHTGANPLKDWALYRTLYHTYRQHKPDILFHFTVKPNIYGTLAAHRLGIPMINNVSGLGTVFLTRGFSSFVAKVLYRWSFSCAQLVFFQNEEDRQLFLSTVQLPNLPTDLVPGSGIDLQAFQPSDLSSHPNKIFIMIARLLVDKGVLEYIEAARAIRSSYPQAIFQLLGKFDTNHARAVSKSIIDLAVEDGTISYLGETNDVRPYIEQATCVVLPSYREGTPRTMLEAAAMARPVITTDVAGCREVVRDGISGLLCRPKDSVDLADKMNQICALTPEKLADWGRAGRNLIVEKFDEQIVVDKYLKQASNIINQFSTE